MVIVDEQDLEKGIRELAARQHLIAEGAGIAGVAAVLSGKLEAKGRTIAAIVSGSNIDLERLTDVMQRDR
jgi:threonine dehydratase